MAKVNGLFQDAQEAKEYRYYALATEVKGAMINLKLPLMTKLDADKHANKLRELSDATIFVIDTRSE